MKCNSFWALWKRQNRPSPGNHSSAGITPSKNLGMWLLGVAPNNLQEAKHASQHKWSITPTLENYAALTLKNWSINESRKKDSSKLQAWKIVFPLSIFRYYILSLRSLKQAVKARSTHQSQTIPQKVQVFSLILHPCEDTNPVQIFDYHTIKIFNSTVLIKQGLPIRNCQK